VSRPSDWEPLAPEDPTPGDTYEIRQLARQMGETAQAIKDAVTALNKIHDSSTVWESEAGREFKTRTRKTADTIDKAFQRYDEVSDALYAYARDLDPVQADADDLLVKVRCAQDEADSAQRKADNADPDTQDKCDADAVSAGQDLQDLKTKLEPIRAEWDRIGNVAADAVKEIIEGDDLKDSRWDDFKGFVADLTEIAGLLSAIFGVLALICTLVPGLQPFAALFGALALVTGLISLAGNLFLMSQGMATLEDVLWDVAGVISFGAGRAFTMTARNTMKAARGMAKPAYIKSLRAAGKSPRQAKRAARARGITQGGREAKTMARAYKRGEVSWVPKGRDVGNAVRHPFRDVSPRVPHGLPDDVAALPDVAVAVRQSNRAAATANAAGVTGSTADGNTLVGQAEDRVGVDVPVLGDDKTPVER
jgi:uncharacterized protein YukE